MKQQFLLMLASAKSWLKHAAPVMFVFLKSLNQGRKRLWASPFVWLAWSLFRLEGTLHGLSALRRRIPRKNWI